jgi:hypothetical protein
MDLVVRAGKDQLTDSERESLGKTSHPLLAQIADPNTKKLIRLFADLPQSSRRDLLAQGYLKWEFSGLDSSRQQVWRDLVQVNIDMAKAQGAPPNPAFSPEALARSQVGFAVVDISEAKTKVVSWYILWPELPPTWVTVVGARAAGTQPYFSAHLAQLPLLKDKPESPRPA